MQSALLAGIMLKKVGVGGDKREPISTEFRLTPSPSSPVKAQPHMFDEQLSQPIRIFQTLLQLLQEIAERVSCVREKQLKHSSEHSSPNVQDFQLHALVTLPTKLQWLLESHRTHGSNMESRIDYQRAPAFPLRLAQGSITHSRCHS